MIKKIGTLLNRQYKNVNAAAFVLAGFTLISQIFGIVRDRLLAGQIGPGNVLDTYVTAFQIPDLVFAIGASLVSVTILIPFLAEYIVDSNDGIAEARTFLNDVFSVFLAGMIGVSIILFILMPWLAPLVAPGFSNEMIPDLVKIARIMLLSPILLGVSNLFGSVTQTYRKFFVYALSPIVYNVGIIIGIALLYPLIGITGLAWGVVIGALLHVLVQVPVIIRHGFLPRFKFKNINWPVIGRVVGVSLPRTLTLAFTQIIVTVLIAFATRFGEGAASIFRFALTLNTVPVTLIGVSYSVAAFPSLVDMYTQGNTKGFIDTLLRPARQIIFWSIPITVMFIVFRAQIVRILFGTGAFDWADTRMTAAILAVLVISVSARGLIGLIVRGYYAAGKTWRPFAVNAISAGATIGIAFLGVWVFDQFPFIAEWLERTLRVYNVSHTRLLVLGLAYSIGTFLNFLVIWHLFRYEFKIFSRKLFFSKPIYQSIVVSLLMGSVGYIMLQILSTAFNLDTFIGVFLQGFVSGLVGLLVAILALHSLQSKALPGWLRFGYKDV